MHLPLKRVHVPPVPAVTEGDIEKEGQLRQEQKRLLVEQIMEIVRGGSSSITAHAIDAGQTPAMATATLLYNLAKRAEQGVPSSQKQLAQEAAAGLIQELTAHQNPSSSAPDPQQVSLLAQLSPLDFALSAWSASKLKQQADADVAPLCTAIMQHALQSSILADFRWVDWARLLYGLTMSGFTCKESPHLQQLYDQCLAVLTPNLVKHNPDRESQNVSNIIYAGARAGAVTSNWKQYVAAVAAGHAAGTAMVVAEPRHWSNIVWACKILGVYNSTFLSTAASAILEQVQEVNAQGASNTLIAMADMGWYEPAVYDALVHALLHDISGATPQGVSNVLYACCLAQHLTPAVQKLADAATASKEPQHWVAQHVSNSLLACGVFALHVRDSSKQAPVVKLSRVLFQTASKADPGRYLVPHLHQLERAHHAAAGMGLPCLYVQSQMFRVVQQEARHDAQQLVRRQPLPFQHAVNCAAAATGRYRVVPPSIRNDDFLIQQEAQHKHLGYSIAVYALNQNSYFRHPLGRLTGPARLRLNRLTEHIPVIVVVLEHEWLALGSDQAAQVAHVDQLLQQAEAAIAAARVPAKQHSGDGGASQSRAEPVFVGLPPQEYYHPQENQSEPADELTGAAPPALPAPGPPQLTPAEAQARLRALQQQQQQDFFKGLPPAPASGLNQGAKTPAQHQQLQQEQRQPSSLTPPQAIKPAAKPPRRPGA
jgi:hypothetical protein